MTSFLKEVSHGLSKKNKKLSSKWFYDFRGSKLFEKITKLKTYYPTKTERKILEVKFKILIKYRKSSQYVQGINDAENEILNSQLAYFPNIVSQCRIELGLIYDKQGKIVNHISTDNES